MHIGCLNGILCFYLLLIITNVACMGNPYEVLGVKQQATFQEIKRSYKLLARKWHPDKNDDPLAQEKFLEVKQAYELLSDPERRNLYDKNGITEDTPNFRHNPDYGQFHRFEPFERFFTSGNFRFEFDGDQGTFFQKQSITKKAFTNMIIPNSAVTPCLILFYTDLCLRCIQSELIWRKITEEMTPLGIEVATVHANIESALAKSIGVNSLPYLTLVLDGHVYHYKELQLNFARTIDFIKSKFFYGLVTTVTSSTADSFLNGWTDNRVRILLFTKKESIRLRYLVVAFYFRKYAVFGQVQLGTSENDALAVKYHVSSSEESLLIFNEDTTKPVASIISSGNDIPVESMKSLISANKFLILPRISSQDVFDQLCPYQTSRNRKRLCVLLVSQNVPAHEPYREALRKYVRINPPDFNRVRYAYIFADRQIDFMKALKPDSSLVENIGIVVLWRKSQELLQYKWLPDNWSIQDDCVNISGDGLYSTVANLLHSKDALSSDAAINILVDEHVQSLVTRVLLKMVMVTRYLRENLSKYEVLPALSILLTIVFVAAGGYFMSYLMKLEEASISERLKTDPKLFPGPSKKNVKEVSLMIHELRGETYNGLVRLLKPGCRTIILLVDAETKVKLFPAFFRTCFPYRRNKSLMFALLMLEKNLEWYRRLLIQTLAEPRELNINPKNCIGTVLSLNGHRKYFCMYHAKYQEPYRASTLNKRHNGGEFVGFEDTSESSESETSDVEIGPKIESGPLLEPDLSEDHLLDGFPSWLDRLFDGETQRYYIKFWPTMK